MASVQVTGLKTLFGKLRELPHKLAAKIVRKGIRRAAEPVLRTAKALCPVQRAGPWQEVVSGGRLRESIKIRVGIRKGLRVKAQVVAGGKDYTGRTFYGGFVEFGHRIGKRSAGIARMQKEKSRARGRIVKDQIQARIDEADTRARVEARPFMRPAADQNKAAVLAVLREEISEALHAVTSGISGKGATLRKQSTKRIGALLG